MRITRLKIRAPPKPWRMGCILQYGAFSRANRALAPGPFIYPKGFSKPQRSPFKASPVPSDNNNKIIAAVSYEHLPCADMCQSPSMYYLIFTHQRPTEVVAIIIPTR